MAPPSTSPSRPTAPTASPISKDAGKADSIGEEVIVGGAPTGVATGSGSFGGRTCTKAGGPVVHARARISATGIVAQGVSSNHGCAGHIVSVGVAVARSVGRKCQFLGAKGKFGRSGLPSAVVPADPRHDPLDLPATRSRLAKGVYLLWAHATNSKRLTTRNTAHKHVFMRLS